MSIYLSRFREARDFEIKEWVLKNFPYLTKEQIEYIRTNDIFKYTPFKFLKQRDKVKVNPLWRLTILPFFIVVFFMVLWLPFNLMFTGEWGYKRMKWLSEWSSKLNINVLS